MTTTCPVCGTQCRIAGDPSSVTRWYEPVAPDQTAAIVQQVTAAMHQPVAITDSMMEWALLKAAVKWVKYPRGTGNLEALRRAVATYQEARP